MPHFSVSMFQYFLEFLVDEIKKKKGNTSETSSQKTKMI